MKHLQEVLQKIEVATIKLSGEKINQIQRNDFKAQIVNAIIQDLKDNGFDANLTKDGAIIHLENETTSVYVGIDGTIKNLDYDLQGAVDEYNESVSARVERERLAKAKKEKALADKKKKSA